MKNADEENNNGLTIDLVIDHLSRSGDEPPEFGLTVKKVMERAVEVSDPDHPNCVVFEMERHQPVMGAVYIRGLPMSAFVASIIRYGFDPEKDELTQLAVIGEPELHCNFDVLTNDLEEELTFCCVVQDDGSVMCSEDMCNEQVVVDNVDEAEAFGRRVFEGLDDESAFNQISDLPDQEMAAEIVVKLQEHRCGLAGSAARVAWEERE